MAMDTKLTFLIVDDESLIRSAMKRVLISCCKNLSLKVELCIIEACDGIETLFALYLASSQNIKINAIISDETMPFLSGNESSKIIETLIEKGVIRYCPMYISTALSHTIPKSSTSLVKKIYSKPIDKSGIKEILENLNIS